MDNLLPWCVTYRRVSFSAEELLEFLKPLSDKCFVVESHTEDSRDLHAYVEAMPLFSLYASEIFRRKGACLVTPCRGVSCVLRRMDDSPNGSTLLTYKFSIDDLAREHVGTPAANSLTPGSCGLF